MMAHDFPFASGWQLPYFPQPVLEIGGLQFHTFGALVGLAILVGVRQGSWLAARRGISPTAVRSIAISALVPGFLGAAVADTLFYHPERLGSEGFWELFNVSEGMSSVGGFLGAALGILICLKIMGLSRLLVGDICVRAVVVCWPVARLACTLAHDHQGRLSDFPLAVAYPEGARHNLGFYECLYAAIILVPTVVWMERQTWHRRGMTMGVVMVLYGAGRWCLDALRSVDQTNSDLRLAGWTFAQAVSTIMFLGGLALLWHVRRITEPTAR